jgi:lipopolysaccharide transport system ATP-binding protein
MNTDIAINIEHLSKRYRIGVKEEMNDTIGQVIIEFIKSPLKNYRRYRSLYKFADHKPGKNQYSDDETADIIWALKDLSLKIKKGEVVGIIGRNGAGKSTLLKILSKITDPTRGRVEIRGRISSLLEVGTGFHPELTGRENVYLNGTILGMRKREIDLKFDEIVEFSGIEKFIDTPVKRYSSGMKVRLAFSVAAHLEPEILFIDEVLAVGDAEFQKKCLNKMESVGQQGRTVLFVSHNMSAIARLCERTILLENGKIVSDGPSDKIVHYYLKSGTGTMAVREWHEQDNSPGNDAVRLRAVRILDHNGKIADTVDIRRSVGIEMEYEVLKPDCFMLPFFNFHNEEGIRVFSAVDLDADWRGKKRLEGRYKSKAWIPGNLLSEGMLFVTASMKTTAQNYWYFYEPEVVSFQVIDSLDGDSARGDYAGKMGGALRPLLKWQTHYSPAGKLNQLDLYQ